MKGWKKNLKNAKTTAKRKDKRREGERGDKRSVIRLTKNERNKKGERFKGR